MSGRKEVGKRKEQKGKEGRLRKVGGRGKGEGRQVEEEKVKEGRRKRER